MYDPALAEHIASHGVRVTDAADHAEPVLPVGGAQGAWRALAEEEAQFERMRASHGETLDHAGRLFNTGVKLMAGSDCGWGYYPFGHFDRELKAMVDAGLTPAQAIQSATLNNAELLCIDDQLGTVEAGKLADVFVVDGDPSADITVLATSPPCFAAASASSNEGNGARPSIPSGRTAGGLEGWQRHRRKRHGNGDGHQDQED